MTPEENQLANNLLRLREVFTEVLGDPDNEIGIFYQPDMPFAKTIRITFDERHSLINLIKGTKNQDKIQKILRYLKYLVRTELGVLLSEFEEELGKLGVDVKPSAIPKIEPPKNDDSGSQPKQPPMEPV